MAAVAHNPGFAETVGVPQAVGRDFNDADVKRQRALAYRVRKSHQGLKEHDGRSRL